MKTLFIFFFFLVSAVASGQILNGDFESWTNGKPDDWDTKVVNDGVVHAILTADNSPYTGRLGFSVSYSAVYDAWYDVFLSNSTSLHPRGSAVIMDASAISFWYKLITRDAIVIASIGGSLDTVSNWTRFSAPITNSPDSILIEFRFSGGMHHGSMGEFFVDDITFEAVNDVALKIQPSSLSISPNPISSHANLRYTISGAAPIHSILYDVTGREVLRLSSLEDASGSGSIPFDVDELPNGLYYLRCDVGGNVTMLKVIVQH